jgi:hypothetical protein
MLSGASLGRTWERSSLMRIHCRLLLGMFGLVAVAAPSLAVAGPYGDEPGVPATFAGQPEPQPATHHHHGLFGRRHCVECQRAYVKAHDGVDVPAPPSIEAGAMVHNHAMAQAGSCPTCQGTASVAAPVMMADAHAPGYAVVGGPESMASAGAPGYAVVNDATLGADPAPIGVSRSSMVGAGDPRMAAMRPRPGAGGSYDPSVMPTSVAPAQVAMQGPGHDRPHIISHLLGLPRLGQIRRGREDKERDRHAAIAYDEPGAKVTELPASMVYGKDGH